MNNVDNKMETRKIKRQCENLKHCVIMTASEMRMPGAQTSPKKKFIKLENLSTSSSQNRKSKRKMKIAQFIQEL